MTAESTMARWVRLAAAGVILGVALLADWPSYREYSLLLVPSLWRHVMEAGAGALVILVSREAWHYVTGIAIVVATALVLPFAATYLTSQLLATPEALWPMMRGTARTALGFSIGLLFFMGVGAGITMVARAFRT